MTSFRERTVRCLEAEDVSVLAMELEALHPLPRWVTGAGCLLAAPVEHRQQVAAVVFGGVGRARFSPHQACQLFGRLLLEHAGFEEVCRYVLHAAPRFDGGVEVARQRGNAQEAALCARLVEEHATLDRRAAVRAYLTAAALADEPSQRLRFETLAFDATVSGGLVHSGAEEIGALDELLGGVSDRGLRDRAVDTCDDLASSCCETWEIVQATRTCVERAERELDASWLQAARKIGCWAGRAPAQTAVWHALWSGARTLGDAVLVAEAERELRGQGRYVGQVIRLEATQEVGQGGMLTAWAPAPCPLLPATASDAIRAAVGGGDFDAALALAQHDAPLLRALCRIATPEQLRALTIPTRQLPTPRARTDVWRSLVLRVAQLAVAGDRDEGLIELLLEPTPAPDYEHAWIVAAGLAGIRHPTWRAAIADAAEATKQCRIAF